MVDRFIAALERPISRVRLENYRPQGANDLEMITNYFFNLEISESLYPALQAFEIALRNSIHLALSDLYGTSYWFDDPHLFPITQPPHPENRQRRSIRDARKTLADNKKPMDSDRIVAELHFGFWHGMLIRPFESKIWRIDSWRLLRETFPNAPRRNFDRQIAWTACDRIRIIRNRVMHYEPVWSRPHLGLDHRHILESLRWLSIDMHETIAMCDRFPDTYQFGRASVAQRLQHEIQRRYPTPVDES